MPSPDHSHVTGNAASRRSSWRLLLAPGLLVAAACGGESGPNPQGDPVRIQIAPGALLLRPGATGSLRVVGLEADGDTVEIEGTVTWESSRGDVVSVSPAGLASAGSAGLAVITARAGALVSPPAVALVATPAAGVVLVPDAQAPDGRIEAVDPVELYGAGWRYRVRLSGPPPAVGQLLLGAGQAPIAGRVLDVAAVAGGSLVTLELRPLSELLPDLAGTASLPLDAAEVELSPELAGAFRVERQADGRIDVIAIGGAGLRAPRGADGRPALFRGFTGDPVEFPLGPFKCELEGQMVSPSLDGSTFSFDPELDFEFVVANGTLEKAVVKGGIVSSVELKPRLTEAIGAALKCKKPDILRIRIPVGGPLAFLAGGSVPIGAGFAIEGDFTVLTFGFDATAGATATAEVGIACPGGNCELVKTLTSNLTTTFKWILPDLSTQFRINLKINPHAMLGLAIGSPVADALFDIGELDLVVVKYGVRQTADLAPASVQMNDAAYASAYELKGVGDIGPGKTVADALGAVMEYVFGREFEIPSLSLPEIAISSSPQGTVQGSSATIAAGDSTDIGVTLTSSTYLGAYAVDSIVLFQRREGPLGPITEPLPGDCGALVPIGPQTAFSCRTAFAEPGDHDIFAFVAPRLFGFGVPTLLELAAETKTRFTVGGFRITTASVPAGKTGIAYSTLLVTEEGPPPITWSIDQGVLPPGLTLEAATGRISGTPAARGSFGFSIRAAASDGQSVARAYTIRIDDVAGIWAGTFNGTFTSFDGSEVRESPGTITLTLTQTGTAVSGSAVLEAFLASATGSVSATFEGAGLADFTMSAVTPTDPPCAGNFSGTAVVDVVAGAMTVNYSGSDCRGTITGAVAQLTRTGN